MRRRGLSCACPARAVYVTSLRPRFPAGSRRLFWCWPRCGRRLSEVGSFRLSHGGGGAHCSLGCTNFPRDVAGDGGCVRAGASCLRGGLSGHRGRVPEGAESPDGPKVATSCKRAPGRSCGLCRPPEVGEGPRGDLLFRVFWGGRSFPGDPQ